MNLYLARDLARGLMAEHGLTDWSFSFDRAQRRFGVCRWSRKVISLSRVLTLLNSENEVRDTILHEIAHALVPGDGHGRKWKSMCVKLGAKPKRCFSWKDVVAPPQRRGRLEIGCPKCDWWQERFRCGRRKLFCRACRTQVVFREKVLSTD